MEEVTLAEARSMFPILGREVARAAHQGDTLDLDTDRLIQGFLREARANGAKAETRRRVTAIRRTAGGWCVEAGDRFEARVLVDAAGPGRTRWRGWRGSSRWGSGRCAGRWRGCPRRSTPRAGRW
jgi:glycerol-3-phosphate dehydrogenase